MLRHTPVHTQHTCSPVALWSAASVTLKHLLIYNQQNCIWGSSWMSRRSRLWTKWQNWHPIIKKNCHG